MPAVPPRADAADGRRSGRRSSMAANRRRSAAGTVEGTGTTPRPAGAPEHRVRVAVAVRPGAGEREQHRRGEREDVAGRARRFTARLLRRHVRGGSDNHPGCREAGRQVARGGDAEVRERGPAARVEEDVVGLDVAVDDTAAVRGGERIEQGVQQVLDVWRRERARRRHAVGERAPR